VTALLAAADVRAQSDTRENYTPGWKYNHWELKGVPIRLEIGQRDIDNGKAVLVRRDTGEKLFIEQANLLAEVQGLLDRIQVEMLERARAEHAQCIEQVSSWDDFMAALGRNHCCLVPWGDEEEIEEDIKRRSATGDAMGAKSLCIPFDQPDLPAGTACFASGKPAKNWGLFGRSY
jgi:prolyl-tRNA synthetase